MTEAAGQGERLGGGVHPPTAGETGPTVTASRARRGLGAASFARFRRSDARGAHRVRVEAEKRRRERAAGAGAAAAASGRTQVWRVATGIVLYHENRMR